MNASLIDYLKTQIEIIKQIEHLRNTLTSDSGFRINSLFEHISKGKRFINSSDLRVFLDPVKPSINDIYLLVRRYSQTKESKLSFKDFEKMWSPSLSHSRLKYNS